MRRFNISKDFVIWLYSHDTCMCCGSVLDQGRQTHIHHTNAGVRGLVCFSCNYILGQETEDDLNKIKLCLKFMPKYREKLIYRVNQQESLNFLFLGEDKKVENPQRLVRYKTLNTEICPRCDQCCVKRNDGRCKQCQSLEQRARYSGLSFEVVKQLQTIQKCECCDCGFTKENKQCIHHIGGNFRGIICNCCNQVLGDESEQRRMQLLACMLWIEESMIQSDLDGNVERLAEMFSPAA